MGNISTNGKTLYIARHGETVFNAAGRIQTGHVHTPLTRSGFAQADELGGALAKHIPFDRPLQLMSSESGRALQTLAIISEHLERDWHEHQIDGRLNEIELGSWSGRYYRDLLNEYPDLFDMELKLFARIPDDGESYAQMAERLSQWISDQEFTSDMLILMHGMSSRVLRGLLLGLSDSSPYQAPIASSLPQGSIVAICDGAEQIVHEGAGGGEKV